MMEKFTWESQWRLEEECTKCRDFDEKILSEKEPGTPQIYMGWIPGPFSLCRFSWKSGKNRNTLLKSFPGRSFKYTRNSGGARPNSRHLSQKMLVISATANEVFGPEEQPRSAMVTQSDKSEEAKSCSTCRRIDIGLDKYVVCLAQNKINRRNFQNICKEDASEVHIQKNGCLRTQICYLAAT